MTAEALVPYFLGQDYGLSRSKRRGALGVGLHALLRMLVYCMQMHEVSLKN
jgi:hypothetical protein